MISAITNIGKTMFSPYDKSTNVDGFIKLIQKVIDSLDKKVYQIVDNLRAHHLKLVTACIEVYKEYIVIFYLLAYSLEFNPDEYLNQDYKRKVNKNNLPSTKVQLRKNAENYMNDIVKSQEKVANFFKHPSITYMAT